MNNIAANLRRLREEKSLSTKSVAKLFDVDENTYISWEMGLKQPTVDEIITITDTYGIDYTVLFEEPQVKETKSTNEKKSVEKQISPKKEKTLLGLRIAALIMWMGMFGFLAMPIVRFSGLGFDGYYYSEGVSIYDYFSSSSAAYQCLASLIIIFLVFVLTDMFVRLCFSEVAHNKTYIKITNAISIILYAGILATVIAALSMPFDGAGLNTEYGVAVIPIFFAAALSVSIAEKAMSAKNN